MEVERNIFSVVRAWHGGGDEGNENWGKEVSRKSFIEVEKFHKMSREMRKITPERMLAEIEN